MITVVHAAHSTKVCRTFGLPFASRDYYHNRGFSRRQQGRLEDAVRDYSRAIALSPTHSRAYHNRAFAHERLGDLNAAVADCA